MTIKLVRMRRKTAASALLALAGLALATSGRFLGAQANEGKPQMDPGILPPRPTVVWTFAVRSQPQSNPASLSSMACLKHEANGPSVEGSPAHAVLKVDPLLLAKLSTAMQEKLSKTRTVTLDQEPDEIPVGASVISGCITKAKAGNSAKRLIGMNYGASHLEAHVVLLSKTKDGWLTKDSFDVQVKGGDLLPPLGPIGLAAHAIQDTRQNLAADAEKMADKVLKRIAKDSKSDGKRTIAAQSD